MGSVTVAPRNQIIEIICSEGQCSDVLMVSEGSRRELCQNMTHRLVQLCRNHGRGSRCDLSRGNRDECLQSESSATRHSSPCIEAHGDLSSAVFQVEEGCHEAIIDTGASRTVIGSDRLRDLIQSCGDVSIKSAPSSVVFRFGNSGVLKSTQAVFFQRKTGGWIRVEVVPGRTPFLLSNSALSSLKAVLDISDRVLWFKGNNTGIPLKSCRKNLMSVDFGEILRLGQGTKIRSDDDEVYHMSSERVGCESVDVGNQRRVQFVEKPPAELTNFVEKKRHESSHETRHDMHASDQPNPPVKFSSTQARSPAVIPTVYDCDGASEPPNGLSSAVLRIPPDDGRGSRAEDQSALCRRSELSDPPTSRSELSQGMGRDEDSVRKVPREELRGSSAGLRLRTRSGTVVQSRHGCAAFRCTSELVVKHRPSGNSANSQ